MANDLALVAERAILRIVYDTNELIPARQVGLMLERVAAAFTSYTKDNRSYGNARLAVLSVETGSLIASLVAVGEAVETLIQQRNLIGGFLNHINDVVLMLTGKMPGVPKTIDRKAVEALTGPVASGKAIQINVSVNGDNNEIILDRSLIDAVRDHQRKDALRIATEQISERLTARVREPESTKFGGESRALLGTTPDLFRYNAIEGGANGEAFKIRGNWYVRLDDQGGVMNPADLGSGVFLLEGRRYRFKGRWNGVRYDLTYATMI